MGFTVLRLAKFGINVTHIEANYERGLSLDILGYGGLNDYRKDFVIFRDSTLIVRKDNHKFAEIPLKMSENRLGAGTKAGRAKKIDYFIIETKGLRILVSNGETLYLVRGDKLKIADVLPSIFTSPQVEVNFKGFVGDWKNNTGEDRGYVIDTGTALIKRYSLHKKGEFYEIIASQEGNILGRIIVRLGPPRLDHLILKVNNNRHHFLRSEDTISLSLQDKICLEEFQTNLYSKRGIHLYINGHKIKPGEERQLKELCIPPGHLNYKARIKKGSLVVGEIFINMEEE